MPNCTSAISAQPIPVVLDTNIVMDMLHFLDPRTTGLSNAISAGQVRCFGDTVCLAELERVTAYPEFDLGPESRNRLMQTYRGFVVECETTDEEVAPLPHCRDADDQKFLELAARCKAGMLVTRDKQLLRLARHRHKPPPFAIVTAEEAATLLELAAKHPAIPA